MKVLLTGATGFVGSHVLDVLCEEGIDTSLLLRESSNRQFIAPHMDRVEVRVGTLADPVSLKSALNGITHVVHCAGITKATHPAEFEQVNLRGTCHLLEAINVAQTPVQRFIHISSLAACGPATASSPARETDPPRPVSAYGKSKLDSEQAVRSMCKTEYVIVRPPAVYGPRDKAFLMLFKAVKGGFCPRFGSTQQELSLVYVRDLAQVIVSLLRHPQAPGLTVNVASNEVVTDEQLCRAIADGLGVRYRPVCFPVWVLRAVCKLNEAVSTISRRPSILGWDKYRELTAPGWVCDTSVLRNKLGLSCDTTVRDGIRATVAWYQHHKWL